MLPCFNNIFSFVMQSTECVTQFLQSCAQAITDHCAMYEIDRLQKNTELFAQQEQEILLHRQRCYANENDNDNLVFNTNFALELSVIECVTPTIPTQFYNIALGFEAVNQCTAAHKLLALHSNRSHLLYTAFVFAIKAIEKDIYGACIYDAQNMKTQYIYRAYQLLEHVYVRCAITQQKTHDSNHRSVYINEMIQFLLLLHESHKNLQNSNRKVNVSKPLQIYITHANKLFYNSKADKISTHNTSVAKLQDMLLHGSTITENVVYMTQIFITIAAQAEIQCELYSYVTAARNEYRYHLIQHALNYRFVDLSVDHDAVLAYQLLQTHTMKVLYLHYLYAILCDYGESMTMLLHAQYCDFKDMLIQAQHAVDTHAHILMHFNTIFNEIEKQLECSLRAQIVLYASHASLLTAKKTRVKNAQQLLRNLQFETSAQHTIASKVQDEVFNSHNIDCIIREIFQQQSIRACTESITNITQRVLCLFKKRSIEAYVHSMLVRLVSCAQYDTPLAHNIQCMCTQLSLNKQKQCSRLLAEHANGKQDDEHIAKQRLQYYDTLFPLAKRVVRSTILMPHISQVTMASQWCTRAQEYVVGSTQKTQFTVLQTASYGNIYAYQFSEACLTEIVHCCIYESYMSNLTMAMFNTTKAILYSSWILIACQSLRHITQR